MTTKAEAIKRLTKHIIVASMRQNGFSETEIAEVLSIE